MFSWVKRLFRRSPTKSIRPRVIVGVGTENCYQVEAFTETGYISVNIDQFNMANKFADDLAALINVKTEWSTSLARKRPAIRRIR